MSGEIKEKHPLVSVLVALYNDQEHIDECVQSIRNQNFTDWELIVVNDGSKDNSADRMNSWEKLDKRIRVIHGPNNGLTKALNIGLEIVRGDYIARLDAGDVSEPDRLKKQLAFLIENQDHVAVGCHALWITPEGWPVAVYHSPLTHEEIDGRHIGGLPGQVLHPCLMFRTSAIREVGGYSEQFPVAQDYDILLRLSEIGKLACLDEVLVKCRLDLKSVSATRRVEQVRLSQLALTQARRRRQLPLLPALSGAWTPRNEAEIIENWVRKAILSGNFPTARRYAARLLRRRLSLMGFRLAVRAILEELRAKINAFKHCQS